MNAFGTLQKKSAYSIGAPSRSPGDLLGENNRAEEAQTQAALER